MKKIFFGLTILCLALSSCKKDGDECGFVEADMSATTVEISYLENFLNSNGITAVQHPSGIFYVIHEPGTGDHPAICSTVFLKYTGRLMETGQPFDQNLQGYSTVLGGLIVGAQKGLKLVGKTGKIDLYIPPSLAYKDQEIRNQSGQVVIPAQSYIKFEFELADVQ